MKHRPLSAHAVVRAIRAKPATVAQVAKQSGYSQSTVRRQLELFGEQAGRIGRARVWKLRDE